MMRKLTLALLLFCCGSGLPGRAEPPKGLQLITAGATAQTAALFRNLDSLSRSHTLFGHQDANAYGHSWRDSVGRSDVHDVCGSHPAVYGHDLGALTQTNPADSALRARIVDAYRRGAVNTLSWHYQNPVNGGSFLFTSNPEPAVKRILPGGDRHGKFKDDLRRIAGFVASLRGDGGELIPVIFRPWHEFEGEWFWWGSTRCTTEEFVALWRFTIDYLKDTLGVKNFIFAFSPDCRLTSCKALMAYYPGDEYVDLIGMDDYWDFRPDSGLVKDFAPKMKLIADLARERGKLAALTETGLEGIPNSQWWTDVLLRELKALNVNLCYVLVWRNAYDNPTHYYAPFPGQVSSADFIRFRKDPYLLFADDLPDMYR